MRAAGHTGRRFVSVDIGGRKGKYSGRILEVKMTELKMQLATCMGMCKSCGEVEWLYEKDNKVLYCIECLQAMEIKEQYSCENG